MRARLVRLFRFRSTFLQLASGIDRNPAAQVTVTYQTIPLVPVPLLFSGPLTFVRTVEMPNEAMTRMSGMPLIMAIFLMLTSPQYLRLLQRDPLGKYLILGAAAGQIAGYLAFEV